MYKIKFLPTGHIFELPDITAEELKTVAESWAKKHNGEIFNLGYFKQNGRFDIKLLNL